VRGRILLIDDAGRIDAEHLRDAGLVVYEVREPDSAAEQVSEAAPDVIVVAGPTDITELRRRADHATSIILVASERLVSHPHADSALSASANLLYEIHRALILRRSGRRLPPPI
jgi:hypothetical protein